MVVSDICYIIYIFITCFIMYRDRHLYKVAFGGLERRLRKAGRCLPRTHVDLSSISGTGEKPREKGRKQGRGRMGIYPGVSRTTASG